jgi:hypothetical protein
MSAFYRQCSTDSMKKHLISYGCERYSLQRELFRAIASNSEFFDEVTVFTPDDFDIEFAAKMKKTLTLTKGGGFWLWKPYFIKKILDSLDDGDLLIYCGANCIVNPIGKPRFDGYIDRLAGCRTGALAFELPHTESEYTKLEVFQHFNTSEEVIRSKQLMATIIMLRKCEHTSLLVDEWLDTACAHPFLFTDELRTLPQDKDFIAHRYDQSIFSVLRKMHGVDIVPMREYFFDFIRECNTFPFWATSLSEP